MIFTIYSLIKCTIPKSTAKRGSINLPNIPIHDRTTPKLNHHTFEQAATGQGRHKPNQPQEMKSTHNKHNWPKKCKWARGQVFASLVPNGTSVPKHTRPLEQGTITSNNNHNQLNGTSHASMVPIGIIVPKHNTNEGKNRHNKQHAAQAKQPKTHNKINDPCPHFSGTDWYQCTKGLNQHTD
jgi:hypothetical protein